MDFLKDLTIGIEEEYQIVDKESRELTSFISDFMEQGAVLFRGTPGTCPQTQELRRCTE